MPESIHRAEIDLVVLDAETAEAVLRLPGAEARGVRRWSDVASLVDADPFEPGTRARVVVAAATVADVDTERLRALHVGSRCVDALVVVARMDEEDHATLLKAGIGRIERLPLPPCPLDVLFADRGYFAALFPGELHGTRRERVDLTLESRVENVGAVVRILCERCDELGHPNDFVHAQLPLVVDEAVTNAMEHGNDWDVARKVHVVADLTPDSVEIRVSDEGGGFARASVADPLSDGRRERVGGRGLFLMESLMDDVVYRDGGRTVVLRRRLDAATPQLAD